MQLLLDMRVFLWAIWGRNLSETAQEAYLDAHNDLYLSTDPQRNGNKLLNVF